MATLEKRIAPGDIRDIPGWEELALLRAMMEKNDFSGMPMYTFMDEGKTVAVAVVDPDGYPLYAKVWCLEVAPGFRGQGYGRRLLREVLNDFDDVKLVATREAFGFYRNIGFRFVREPDPKSNVGYMVSAT